MKILFPKNCTQAGMTQTCNIFYCSKRTSSYCKAKIHFDKDWKIRLLVSEHNHPPPQICQISSDGLFKIIELNNRSAMLFNNHVFTQHTQKTHLFYCCKRRITNCKAKVHFDRGGKVKSVNEKHSHPPPVLCQISSDISYMYEFVETCRGRELIFQNYSYTRFCQSNIYNCTNKTPQLCYAQVMLDDDKILIISSYHNHVPPFLLRNENGAIVESYMVREEPKIKKRGKPTLGPRATRNQVNSLVASIMNSVKAMENKNEVSPNTSELTAEPEVVPSVSNETTPRMTIHKRTIVPKRKKKITQENNQTTSIVTSAEKNEPIDKHTSFTHLDSLLKVASTRKSELPLDNNTVTQITLSQEKPPPCRIDNVPLLKQDAGSLVTNQMYIVLPNVESGIQHNRFILSPPNVGGLMYGNKIFVSPIQTEQPSSSNNQKLQPVNVRNFPSADEIMPKKIDTNAGLQNKMFFLVQTNNVNPMTPRINENIPLVTNNVEPTTTNEGSLTQNKMLILVHNKNENDSLMSSNTTNQQHAKVSEPNCGLNIPQNEIKTSNVSSVMPKLQPKRLEMKTSIPMASIKNVIFPHQKNEGYASPNDVPSKINDGKAAGSTLMSQKPEKVKSLSVNVQKPVTNKIQSTAYEASESMSRSASESQSFNVELDKILKIAPKKNEMDYSVHSKTRVFPKNVGSISGSNTLLPFVFKTENDHEKLYDTEPLVQLKAETFSAAIDNIIPKTSNEIENENKITNLDGTVPKYIKHEHVSLNKEQKPHIKIEADNLVSTLQSTMQPKNKSNNVRSDLPKQKTKTFMESNKKVLDKNSKNSTAVEANTPKKSRSATENKQPEPAKKTKADNDDVEKPTSSKIITKDYENSKVQSMPHTTENIDSFDTSSNIDFGWIVPKNKKVLQPKKIETEPNKNINKTDNTSSISYIPEIPISVSMIPLPKENDSVQSIATDASDVLEFKDVQPVVMIERLPMKHKAGSSDLRSVPPKKRYYQF